MGGGGKGGGSAAKAQARTQQQAIDLQKQQFDQVTQNLAPYLAAGTPALQQLQGLATLQGQQNALNNYYNSGQFADLANQARYQQLASAEATGGLGSTATGNALASIAPMLGQQWLGGQMQNYGNLMNAGMSAATGQASAGQNYANNAGQLLQGLGSIQAGQAQRGSKFGGFLQGAGSGAAAGSMFGPWGALAGGVIGGVSSLL